MKRVLQVSLAAGVILILLLVLLAGRGSDSIGIVKNGTLYGYEQTTVGKAFDTFFAKPKWSSFETANGTKIVEFTGELPRDFSEEGFTEYGFITSTKPKGGKFLMQFMLRGDEFEIAYGEVTTVLTGPGLELIGANNRSADVPMDDEAIMTWVARI